MKIVDFLLMVNFLMCPVFYCLDFKYTKTQMTNDQKSGFFRLPYSNLKIFENLSVFFTLEFVWPLNIDGDQ